MLTKTRMRRVMGIVFVVAAVFSAGFLKAAEKNIRVAVYRPDKAEPNVMAIPADGVYAALKEAAGMATEYVDDFSPATLAKADVLVVCQNSGLPEDLMETVRNWVKEGHGLMVTHDAVGYRSNRPFFPQISEGTGNSYMNQDPYSQEWCIARVHPLTEGFQPKDRFFLSYYDYIMIDPGKEGVVVVRGVQKSEAGAASSAPAVVCGTPGKGRYVANGAAVGWIAPVGAIKPISGELKLLLNSIRWLAGRDGQGTKPGEDIEQGAALGPNEPEHVDAEILPFRKKVAGLKDVSVENVLAGCEEKVEAQWKETLTDAELKPAIVAQGAVIEMSAAELNAPIFNPLPEGWKEMDLSGQWKIRKLDNTTKNPPDDLGTKEGFWKPEYDDTAWKERPVPSIWDNEDKPYLDGNVGFGMYRTDFVGVGWYRHGFMAPAKEPGKRMILHFRGADYATTAYLNGRKVGEHEGGDHPFEFDVTDALDYGKTNILAVRIYDESNRYYIDVYDWTRAGGLYDKVVLQTQPEVYVRQLLITPHLSNACVEVDAEIVNSSKEPRDIDLAAVISPSEERAAIFPGKGTITETKLGKQSLKPGVNQLNLKADLKDPVCWSDTVPFLYTLRLKQGAEVIGKERFGFREFKVEGHGFTLNGQRVYLRGEITSGFTFRGAKKVVIDNQNNALRRWVMATRSWGCNTIFPQGSGTFMPRLFYDFCDEQGIMIYDWSGYSLAEMAQPDAIEQWFMKSYNHPARVLTALNDEGRHKSYVEATNKNYDRLKKIDKQNRPIVACSGNDPTSVTFKTDVEDIHAYPGDINGHVMDMSDIIKKYNENVWQFYGRAMPILNWEMAGVGLGTYAPQGIKTAREILSKDPVDKETMVGLIEGADAGYEMILNIRWLSMYGIRKYIFDDQDRAEREGKAVGSYRSVYIAKGQFEECRRLGDLIQGMGPNGIDIFDARKGTNKCDLTDADGVLVANESYAVCKRSYNPRFVCLDGFDQNVFGGGKFKATVYAINDTVAPSKEWSIRMTIKTLDGKRLGDKTAAIGSVASFKRKLVPFEWDIPADLPTGFYRTEQFRLEGGKVVSDNDYQFFVMNKADLDQAIAAGGKKVALYDAIGRTQKVLDGLKVAYTKIDAFDDLAKYNVLIIGACSADNQVSRCGEKIRAWLKEGGRLLQYEQSNPGKISYIPQMSILKKYGGTIADMIEINHPLFDKIRANENWDRWSGTVPDAAVYGRVGGIYSALVGPLNQTMLATGLLAVPRETDKAAQMVISEARIGKGIALISQAEATRRYGVDSVATKYLQNSLKYILSDETKYARPISGLKIVNIDYRRCGYMDLGSLLDADLGVADKSWNSKIAAGVKPCGGLRFNLKDKGLLIEGSKVIDLAGKMKLMAPEWEAEKRKQDVNQMGLMLNKAESICFLHTGVGIPKEGKIGKFVFIYEDGTRVEEPLVVGVNIGAREATEDIENGRYVGAGYYVTQWVNPDPERALKSIEVVLEGGKGKVLIAGITAPLVRERVHY